MVDTKEISIIIPCYNASKYLRQCIDSILNQTFKNYEIIFINDKSTDNTLDILQEYKNNSDADIKILENEYNSGPSFTRNKGLSAATGNYIAFIDSDDYIEPQYLEVLYKLIKQYNTEISMCSSKYVTEDGELIKEDTIEFLLEDKISIINKMISFGIEPAMWGKLISRKLINDNHISFEYDGFEDTLFLFDIYCRIERTVCIRYSLYNYRQIETSISHNGLTKHCNYIRTFANLLSKVKNRLEHKIKFNIHQKNMIYKYFLHSSLIMLSPVLKNIDEEKLDNMLDEELTKVFGDKTIYIKTMLYMMGIGRSV